MHAAVTVRALLLAAVALASVASAASADPAVTRVVDRTFSCEAGYVGGLHQVDVNSSYSRPPGATRFQVTSTITQSFSSAAAGQLTSGGFSVHRVFCSPAKGAVKLTTKGMRGGAVPPLGTSVTCETPIRPLVRIRAVFKEPVLTQTTKPFGYPILSATGELERAAMAVGTRTGRTIAYLSVTGAEKARLFTLRTCKED